MPRHRRRQPRPAWWRPYLDNTTWTRSYSVSVGNIAKRGLGLGVELGVAWGWHADQILIRCPRALVLGVDAYDPMTPDSDHRKVDATRHELTMRSMLKLLAPHGNRFQLIRAMSVDAAKLVTVEIDWLFVDASHDERSVTTDLHAWFGKVKRPGGLFMGHDYGAPGHDGVKIAVDRFLKEHGLKLGGVDRSVWWVDL